MAAVLLDRRDRQALGVAMRGRVPSPKLTSSGGPVMRSQGLLRWGFYWREPESIVKHLYGLWQESLDQECRVRLPRFDGQG